MACLGLLFGLLQAQPLDKSEEQSDSLFLAGRYVDAYQSYLQIPSRQRTPEQLLRMAYVQESLQQYPQSLYHLVELYVHTAEGRVLSKIYALAQREQLSGYGQLGEDQWMLLLLAHKAWAFALLGGAWLGCLALCFVQKKKRYVVGVCLMLLSGLLVALVERDAWLPRRAVVLSAESLFCEGPSAAAPRLGVAPPPGSLLTVGKHQAPWIQVWWDDTKGYMLERQLSIVHYD